MSHMEYKKVKDAYNSAGTPLRQFMALAIKSQERNAREMTADLRTMKDYEEAVIQEQAIEAQERAQCLIEDEYTWRIMDATAAARFETDKNDELKAAQSLYASAKALYAGTVGKIEHLEAGAEDFSRKLDEEAEAAKAKAPALYKSRVSRPYQYTFKVSKLRAPGDPVFVVRETDQAI